MPGVWILWSKIFFCYYFSKRNGNTFTLFIIFIVKSLQKEQNSTNLLLCPPICRNKSASTTKWFNSLDTNSRVVNSKNHVRNSLNLRKLFLPTRKLFLPASWTFFVPSKYSMRIWVFFWFQTSHRGWSTAKIMYEIL